LQLAKKTCLEDVKAIETKTYINNPIFPLSSFFFALATCQLPGRPCLKTQNSSKLLKTQQPEEARSQNAHSRDIITHHSSQFWFEVQRESNQSLYLK
jgi:hypothetical protein